MKYKLFITLISLLIAALAAGIIIPFSIAPNDVDVTEVNRIRYESEQFIARGIDMKNDYKYDFILLDPQGNLMAGSSRDNGTQDNAILQAIAERNTVIPLNFDNNEIYYLIVYTDFNADIYSVRYKISLFFGCITGTIILLLILVFVYQETYINRPFIKLHKFAENVAAGDLDLPLDMNKFNSFGAFTEAFDIMRNELKLSREREKAVEDSKKKVIAQLSHDIKSPLSSIRAIAEAQEIKNGGKWCGDIVNKVDEVDKLISDIYYSTLHDLEQLKVNVGIVSSSVVYNNIVSADYKHMVRLQSPPQVLLAIDEFRTNEIFSNLISNSYKYANTPIDIEFIINDNYLDVTVRDSGDGIDEKELAYVTEIFYRGSKAIDSDGEGLGLFIVKKLVNMQGGKFKCYNDEGFVVVVSLPLVGD